MITVSNYSQPNIAFMFGKCKTWTNIIRKISRTVWFLCPLWSGRFGRSTMDEYWKIYPEIHFSSWVFFVFCSQLGQKKIILFLVFLLILFDETWVDSPFSWELPCLLLMNFLSCSPKHGQILTFLSIPSKIHFVSALEISWR